MDCTEAPFEALQYSPQAFHNCLNCSKPGRLACTILLQLLFPDIIGSLQTTTLQTSCSTEVGADKRTWNSWIPNCKCHLPLHAGYNEQRKRHLVTLVISSGCEIRSHNALFESYEIGGGQRLSALSPLLYCGVISISKEHSYTPSFLLSCPLSPSLRLQG